MSSSEKKTILLLLGGQSSEHEISLLSAKNIISALDRDKYELIPVGIDKLGRWWLQNPEQVLEHSEDPKQVCLYPSQKLLSFLPGQTGTSFQVEGQTIGPIDCIFPVLHGPKGEDGCLQGLLKLSDIPFVGCGVLSSAACMDKDICKRLLSQAGLANAKYMVSRKDQPALGFTEAREKLGLPMFIKPANQGSSVGVCKVENESEFQQGLKKAFSYDQKLIIEEAIEGREIECSVLGNSRPVASLPGEVIISEGFYSYENKYLNPTEAKLQIPAKIEQGILAELQNMAIAAYQALECRGLARIDFFLNQQNKLLINEINTLPGFTKISMYPAMWEASGIPYAELVDRLIELAIAEHQLDQHRNSCKV